MSVFEQTDLPNGLCNILKQHKGVFYFKSNWKIYMTYCIINDGIWNLD